MIQRTMDEEHRETMKKAYELFEKHGFRNGDEFLDWLEAERQLGIRNRSSRRKLILGILWSIIAMLCIVVAILLILLFRAAPKVDLSSQSLSDLKVMLLVVDKKEDEKVFALGDTHFNYGSSDLSDEAKTLLSDDVAFLKDNPKVKIRMAGYTSARGTEDSNQKLSENRANAVRNYLIDKGIAGDRITVIGYGRTKPALFEVSPGKRNTDEAKANMRVIFEVVVN